MSVDQQLKKNVISLTVLQIGNYFVPLIILPYLTRVLGVGGFGQIGFATAFTMYFVLLVEWGFNLSATRDISIGRADKLSRSSVFWVTIAARISLTVFSALVLVVLTVTVPKLSDQNGLLWLGMLQVLASALSPAFYYQGVEKMSMMALINLAVRLSSIPLIILIVTKPDEGSIAFAIQTGCFLAASLFNFMVLLWSGEVKWVSPNFNRIKQALMNSTPLFLSSAGISLYTNTNAVILGFVASEAAVGYFVAGFTLVKAVVGLSGPLGQAIFPRSSMMISGDSELSGIFLGKIVRLQGLLGIMLSIALMIFLPWGVTWFYGDAFQETVSVVAWLTLLPLIVCLASSFGMQTLIPLGQSRWFSGVLLLGGLLNCLMLLPFGYVWGASGAAASVVVTEGAIMIGMAMGVKKYAPDIWRMIVKSS